MFTKSTFAQQRRETVKQATAWIQKHTETEPGSERESESTEKEKNSYIDYNS